MLSMTLAWRKREWPFLPPEPRIPTPTNSELEPEGTF